MSEYSEKNFKEFLKDFLMAINEGIHSDLETSNDLLEQHELKDYISSEDGDFDLDIKAMKKDKLKPEEIVAVAINATNEHIHREFHEVMETAAKRHGITELAENTNAHKKSEVEVKVVGDLKDLPKEVRQALRNLLKEED